MPLENSKKKGYSAADRNREKLLKFLSDWENEWPPRYLYSTQILGYKNEAQIYHTLTPNDLTEIEAEALEIRKKSCSKQRSEIYKSLFDEGKSGNVNAAKEFLDRTEGKVTEKKEITGDLKVESHTSIDLEGAKKVFNG